MKIIESTQILKNLKVVLAAARSRFTHDFVMQEVVLNDTFKDAFRNYLLTKDWEVEYFDKTTVVTSSIGLQIYIANQWFVIASYFVDFCTEMLTYRTLFVKICKRMGMSAIAMKEYATKLKRLPTEKDKEIFINVAMTMLRDDFPGREDEYDTVAAFLWSFVSDYNWWAGSKTVERHDFYVSALLNQMKVVNSNSEYLAMIVNSYASTLKLRLLVESVDNFTIGMKENNYEEKNEEKTDLGLVAEPQHSIRKASTSSKRISISAASLERFQSQG